MEVTGPQGMEMERPPGRIGNEVLESETSAEIRTGVCMGAILGRDEDGDLGVGMWRPTPWLHWSPGSVGLGGECPSWRPEAPGVSALLGED